MKHDELIRRLVNDKINFEADTNHYRSEFIKAENESEKRIAENALKAMIPKLYECYSKLSKNLTHSDIEKYKEVDFEDKYSLTEITEFLIRFRNFYAI